jgi:hypothetical protein
MPDAKYSFHHLVELEFGSDVVLGRFTISSQSSSDIRRAPPINAVPQTLPIRGYKTEFRQHFANRDWRDEITQLREAQPSGGKRLQLPLALRRRLNR